jgi:hypothetical protein
MIFNLRVFVDVCASTENGCCSANSVRDLAEDKIRLALAYLTDEVHAGNRPNVMLAGYLAALSSLSVVDGG